jgi:hypothetical protein
MQNIERPHYINRVKPFINTALIKVLVGQRRVGKSFLLRQISDLIKKQNPDKRIIYINKEHHEFLDLKNETHLLNYVAQEADGQTDVALFVDEVQDISGFEIALRDLLARGSFDIYISGSNAQLLSGELATYLSGRYIEIRVHGLNYAEYMTFFEAENTSKSFQTYLSQGGMPFLVNLPAQADVQAEYLKNIYSSILLKDVVARHSIRNVAFLENLVWFTANNVGSILSAKKISDYLKSQRVNISPQVVLDYLAYLQSSFIINKVKRADITGKRIFEIGEKYYFEDLGLRNAIVGYTAADIHKLLENIIYLHLSMAGYRVFVGADGGKEIDFIADKEGSRIYVQVAYMLSEPQTMQREFGNLLAIQDNFPKYVVTLDELADSSAYKGIIRMHAKDFCLEVLQN